MTIPITFHIQKGVIDEEFIKFTKSFVEGTIWIIKPGEHTNRGSGISILCDYAKIKNIIETNEMKDHTYILQRYIESPLLINKRKFDIRIFGMITSVNGIIKGYFYDEGYIRTSSKKYTLKNLNDKIVHLTKDAIQKYGDDYGKYENGKKLSFGDFQAYLNANYRQINIDFYRDLLPQIKVHSYNFLENYY